MPDDESTHPDTINGQLRELSHNIRELRDEAFLKPAASLLESVGIETIDVDDESEDISLFREGWAAAAPAAVAGYGMLLGYVIAAWATGSPGVAIVVSAILGAVGFVLGYIDRRRYYEGRDA